MFPMVSKFASQSLWLVLCICIRCPKYLLVWSFKVLGPSEIGSMGIHRLEIVNQNSFLVVVWSDLQYWVPVQPDTLAISRSCSRKQVFRTASDGKLGGAKISSIRRWSIRRWSIRRSSILSPLEASFTLGNCFQLYLVGYCTVRVTSCLVYPKPQAYCKIGILSTGAYFRN